MSPGQATELRCSSPESWCENSWDYSVGFCRIGGQHFCSPRVLMKARIRTEYRRSKGQILGAVFSGAKLLLAYRVLWVLYQIDLGRRTNSL